MHITVLALLENTTNGIVVLVMICPSLGLSLVNTRIDTSISAGQFGSGMLSNG